MAQRQFRSDDTSTWVDRFGNGSDGALTISGATTEAPIDASCSGTAGTTSLAATNASFAAGQLLLIHQTRGTGVGAWELNKIQSYSAGTITTAYTLINTYTDSGASQAQVRVLPQYSAVTVNVSQTWTAKAWDGNVGGILAFVCNGTTTVTGNISATGKGFVGGAGGASGDAPGTQGEGTPGTGSSNNQNANGNAGGGTNFTSTMDGGSGGGGGAGGFGGGTGGLGQQGPAGVGGSAVGVAALTTADLGGAGGGGSAGRNGSNNGGEGGNGGGFIVIISKTISITGTVVASGQTGISATNNSGGGGGGGGGSVLLKGQNLTLGTNLITAAGADGGAAATAAGAGSATGAGSNGTNGTGSGNGGGGGGAGRIHADYSTSISGSTQPSLDSTQDTTFIDPAVASRFLSLHPQIW